MAGIDEIIGAKRAEIASAAIRHHASRLSVFGSVARGEAGPESDVDLLVEMTSDAALLDLGALVADLEALLSRKVDVVEPEALHWFIRDRILQEAVPLEF